MRHSHKKAKHKPTESNPEHVLRDIPVPASGTASVEVSMPCESFLKFKRLALPEISSGMVVDTGDDDDEREQAENQYEKVGTHHFAPTIAEAEAAFEDIKQILKPSCKNGPRYVHRGLDEFMTAELKL